MRRNRRGNRGQHVPVQRKDDPWAYVATAQANTPKTLSITTRGIGFGVCHLIKNAQLYNYNDDDSDDDDDYYKYKFPSIYTLYRVFLGMLEYKLEKLPSCGLYEYTYKSDIYKYIDSFYYSKAPEPLKTLLEAVGTVNVQGTQYIPAIAKEIYENGQLVPRPENMLLSNLRRSVEALSSETTPLAVREDYNRNSAIPGAIWDQTLLRNPDDIIPQDYDHVQFSRDSNKVASFISWLDIRSETHNKKLVGEVDLNQSEGNKSIFVSNKMQTLRAPDRKPDEELEAYHNRCRPEGRIDEYYGLVALSTAERGIGQANLLGEYPDSVLLRYPLYHLRDDVGADIIGGDYFVPTF